MPSFPTSVFAPASRSAGQTIQPAHVNDLQDEVNAIEGGYLNGTARLNSSASTVASLGVTGASTIAGRLVVSSGLSVVGNSTLGSSMSLGTIPYVFPSSGGSTGDVLTCVSTSGSTMSLEWRTGASSAATNGFTVSTGVLTLNQGAIAFPGTQVASAGANTLDDYEEGTWTPTIGGSGGQSGQTYTTQNGRYVKIGQLVLASYHITLSAKGTITTNCQIQGLPFTSLATQYFVSAVLRQTMATNWVEVIAIINLESTTAANLAGATAAATGNTTNVVAADIADTTTLSGVLMYRASA